MGSGQGKTRRVQSSRGGSQDEETLRGLHNQWQAADLRAPRQQTATVASAKHPSQNEDRALCDPAKGIAAVFDGMGGEDGGEMASSTACGLFTERLEERSEQTDDLEAAGMWLRQTLMEAGQAVRVNQRLYSDLKEQAATGIVVQLIGNKALVSSVGDSRVYRYSAEGGLERLGYWEDHRPEMRELNVRLDEVDTREELRGNEELLNHFYQRNIIDEALGYTTKWPGASEHDVASGDILFACTDGIHDNLTGA